MKEKALCLSEFVLKVVAIITMTLDHLGIFLNAYFAQGSPAYLTGNVFRILGRIAFPLFAFMLAEGMRHSRHREKYLLRLAGMLLAMLLVEVVAIYGFGIGSLQGNPFMDLTMGGLAIYLLDQLRKEGKRKWLALLAILPIAYIGICFGVQLYETSHMTPDGFYSLSVDWLPGFLRADYSLLGLILMLGSYYAYDLGEVFAKRHAGALGVDVEFFKMQKDYRYLLNLEAMVVLLFATTLFWLISYAGMDSRGFRPYDVYFMAYQSWGLLAIPFLLLYSGKRGYDSKGFRWFSYLYFPLHLAIIFLVFALQFGW
ncbi:MAG: hypothetical protein J6038_04520 [Bacilli bacterium]|nr:hypothetical protein [Bacilli bacterium]